MKFNKQKACSTAKEQLTLFINSARGRQYIGLVQALHHQGRSIRQIVGYLTGTGALLSRQVYGR